MSSPRTHELGAWSRSVSTTQPPCMLETSNQQENVNEKQTKHDPANSPHAALKQKKTGLLHGILNGMCCNELAVPCSRDGACPLVMRRARAAAFYKGGNDPISMHFAGRSLQAVVRGYRFAAAEQSCHVEQ